MTINRRHAASSATSSEKKQEGHAREDEFSKLIDGHVFKGTTKVDVKDKFGRMYSVKGGTKWQIFLYSYERISSSNHLKILKNCLDSFGDNFESHNEARTKCIEYKEKYIRDHGNRKARDLQNSEIERLLEPNEYMDSKKKLQSSTLMVVEVLQDKKILRSFLNEAIFNNDQISLVAIKDMTYLKDNIFKVFEREDVLDILCSEIFPDVSKAGKAAVDYNVSGQKTILRYFKNGNPKNIAEIEIRNDSKEKYRSVRFNMYSKDVLSLLLRSNVSLEVRKVNSKVKAYGKAASLLVS